MGFPFFPTLEARYNTGPFDVIKTNMEITRNIGKNIIKIKTQNNKSNKRLNNSNNFIIEFYYLEN